MVTFDPIPKCFLIKVLQIIDFQILIKKADILKKNYNVDFLINKKFDKKFSKISCHNFIKIFYAKKLSAKLYFC